MEQMSPAHAALRLLDELSAEATGALVPKSMVFDRLLDLRNLAADRPLLVAAIDNLLREVPGATLAPGEWWRAELVALRKHVGGAPCLEGVS